MKLEEFYRICDSLPFNENGCQIWPRGKYPKGYPQVKIHKERKPRYGHRLILERKLDRFIKPKYQACHTCDIPSCVNPNHLFEGTSSDNHWDASKKGRLPCGNNHHMRKKLLSSIL